MNQTKRVIALAPVLIAVLSLGVYGQRRGSASRPTQLPATPSQVQERKPAATGNLKPAGKHLSERQKGNIKQLESDLNAIKQGSQVTQQQKDNLASSLMAMAEGATKPNPDMVKKLADDLSVAISDGRLSANEKYKISEDLEDVMNSANISEAEFEKAIADAQAIFIASGINKSQVQIIVYDMKQINDEIKNTVKGAPKRQH